MIVFHLPLEPPPRRRFAARLGGDLLELTVLQGGQGAAGAALVGIGEGAAIGGDALLDRAQELAFPFRERYPRLVGLGFGAFQRPERDTLDARLFLGALLLQRGRRLVFAEYQRPPMAER